ncbi:MAG: polyphosphate kinase 2 family protein [Ignavibacteriaceae bacterium]|jgi:PPK2 family polyphosphate:nucleotide phosphotransferase
MIDISKFRVLHNRKIKLGEFPTHFTGENKAKKEARKMLKGKIEKLTELQDKLYAYDKYSLLIIFQAMDAAGKDSAIKHVMSGLNPQGTQVFSFKKPSAEELDHGYLWRIAKSLPERGRIGIFNRSHYEELLVVRVHNLIKFQKLPAEFVTKDIWNQRYTQINNFEQYLSENGMVILKFFLHVSKEEQKNRFLKRLTDPSKNWKFSAADLKERSYWDKYMNCYEEAISATNTDFAPWIVVPADNKWFARLIISDTIIDSMEKMNLEYPKLDEEQLKNLESYKKQLDEEQLSKENQSNS